MIRQPSPSASPPEFPAEAASSPNDDTSPQQPLSTRGRFKVCMVCGDRALSCNFGAVTCESCKAFFRRHATKEIWGQCDGRCPITLDTRSYCRRCRLHKCLAVGMRKDLILTDEQKERRRQKIVENRKRRQGWSASPTELDYCKESRSPPSSMDIDQGSSSSLYSMHGGLLSPGLATDPAPAGPATSSLSSSSLNALGLQVKVEDQGQGQGQGHHEQHFPAADAHGGSAVLSGGYTASSSDATPRCSDISDFAPFVCSDDVSSSSSSRRRLSSSSSSLHQSATATNPLYVPAIDGAGTLSTTSSQRVPTAAGVADADGGVDIAQTVIMKNTAPYPVPDEQVLPTASSYGVRFNAGGGGGSGGGDYSSGDDLGLHPRPSEVSPSTTITTTTTTTTTTAAAAATATRMPPGPDTRSDPQQRSQVNANTHTSSFFFELTDEDEKLLRALPKPMGSSLFTVRKAQQAFHATGFPDHNTQNDSLSYMELINSGEHVYRGLVIYAKQIPEFRQLGQEDQITLLKGNVLNVLILRFLDTYDSERHCWFTYRNGEKYIYDMPAVASIGTMHGFNFQMYQEFVMHAKKVTRDDHMIVAMLVVLAMFIPDVPNLQDVDLVRRAQDTYCDILQQLVKIKYPDDVALYDSLLQVLHNVQKVGKMAAEAMSVSKVQDLHPLVIEMFNLK